MTDPTLTRLAGTARCVLLDFDGPVCSIYAGRSAHTVAADLRALIRQQAGATTPAAVPAADDPLAVLRAAGTISADLAHRVETALRTAEVTAAATARPTPGAAELLTACQHTGRPVAIVSNNATPAITAYLTRTGLADLVAHVEGRDPTSPALMKPSPHLVFRALAAVGADPAATILVGDSPSDIAAAHAVGLPAVGYANKPGKTSRLATAGADTVITTLDQLTHTLHHHPAPH